MDKPITCSSSSRKRQNVDEYSDEDELFESNTDDDCFSESSDLETNDSDEGIAAGDLPWRHCDEFHTKNYNFDLGLSGITDNFDINIV